MGVLNPSHCLCVGSAWQEIVFNKIPVEWMNIGVFQTDDPYRFSDIPESDLLI